MIIKGQRKMEIKCESCGGPLNILPGINIVKCEFCGSVHRLTKNQIHAINQTSEKESIIKYPELPPSNLSGICSVKFNDNENSDRWFLYMLSVILISYSKSFQRNYQLSVDIRMSDLMIRIKKGFFNTLKRTPISIIKERELNIEKCELREILQECGFTDIEPYTESYDDDISYGEFIINHTSSYGYISEGRYDRRNFLRCKKVFSPTTTCIIPTEMLKEIKSFKDNTVINGIAHDIVYDFMIDKVSSEKKYRNKIITYIKEIREVIVEINATGIAIYYDQDPHDEEFPDGSLLRKGYLFSTYGIDNLDRKQMHSFASVLYSNIAKVLSYREKNNPRIAYTYEIAAIGYQEPGEWVDIQGERSSWREKLIVVYSLRNRS